MTATDIDVRQPSAALAIRPGQEFWTREQRAALSVLGIRGASNADLAVFMHYCQKTQLDPFSRQIYGIMRREKQDGEWVDKFTIQVGIDGFRVIRDRIAHRLGIEVEYEDTVWYDDDGREHAVWLSDQPPAACRVVVLRNGRRFPAVVRTSAYAAVKDGRLIAQWRTQPEHMIEKCAEAFALRRAFPHDLGGLYIDEEMPPPPAELPRQPVRVTVEEITGNGAHPAAHEREPENPTPAAPTAATAPTAAPATARTAQPAAKAAVEKLDKLVRTLDLGPDDDVRDMFAWLTGAPWTATRSQVDQADKWLHDHLEAAQGDVAAAAAAAWTQFRRENPQAGDDSA